MHRTLGTLVAAALLATQFSFAQAATTPLNVTARKDNLQGVSMADVTVAAINFGVNGPSTYTVIGRTLANGTTTLYLENNRDYNLFYSSHGFSPTIRDQFNNPDPGASKHFWPDGIITTLYSTVTLTALTGDATNVGRIELGFINATPNKVLFGGVNNNMLQEPGSFGIVMTNGAGAGTLAVDNVPYAAANTYNIGLYDSEKNKGVGRSVVDALNAALPVISWGSGVDFNDSIAPPRVENTASKNNEGGSNLSVQGVVRSTDTNWVPIPYNGVNFQSCVGGAWAQVDENGAFQLYNLSAGATYYAEAYGGCTWTQDTNDCYEAYKSPGIINNMVECRNGAPDIGTNDFVYLSSNSIQNVRIKLNRVEKSTGTIRVYVKSASGCPTTSGCPIPNANVNINPDGSGWSTDHCVANPQVPGGQYSTVESKPGLSNANTPVSATGYALLDGLPSGNYMLNVWTPFTQNTASTNGPSPVNDVDQDGFDWNWNNAHCTGTGADDIRINVDTTAVTSLHVYNAAGVDLNLSSITVIVNTGSNTSGVVQGTLKFPSTADLSGSPIMLTLQPQCDMNGCIGQGNFTVISSSDSDHYAYSIPVASGAVYFMNVTARGWGRVKMGGGDDQINLRGSTFTVVNMNFAPTGVIKGTVYKPDGTVLVPGKYDWIGVNAGSNNGWTYAQVQKDGTFAMYDVLPGINRITMQGGGSTGFAYALPSPAPQVNVTVGGTANINLNLVNATYVSAELNISSVPNNTVISDGYESMLGFKVLTLPAGTVLKSGLINELINKGGDEAEIRYSGLSGVAYGNQGGPCGAEWHPAGFCAARFPSPALYDLYLMRSGGWGNMSSTTTVAADRPYPHFTLITSSKNVIVDAAHATAPVRPQFMGTMPSTGVVVNLTPASNLHSRGNTKLFGSVTAKYFFRSADYDATGGDFDKFTNFLPIVTLYEENGAFAAAGIVVPPPAFIATQEKEGNFDKAFAQDYTAFMELLKTAPSYSYEIRDLAPNTCYTEVLTTPNYPPYQTKVCMRGDGTAEQVDINLDTAVGKGATVQGVVKSTAAALIADAAVEISGEGIDPKSAVTNTSGAYIFEGLPPGDVKVKISAPGYALSEAEAELSGTEIVPLISTLTAASGSITGTVYSQKLPFVKVQPGAEIYAYDDTYNGTPATSALPLPVLKTITGSSGTYTLTGLVAGDTYRVFLKVPGKYTLNQSTMATNGVISGIDFTMLAKPLDIEIFARKGAAYEFTVLNPLDFKNGTAKWSESPYNAAAATELPLQEQLSGVLRAYIPLDKLSAGKTYVLHAEAVSYSNKTVVKDLPFGLDYKGNAQQAIDGVLIGDDSDNGKGGKNNEAAIDQSGGDPSALVVPPGVLLPLSTAAVPSCTFKGEDKNSADADVAAKVDALGKDAFAGNLYTIALSSVATANPDKGFDVTLAYDKNNSSLNDLSVASYNSATEKWDTLDAVATVNPVKGTVKVKLKKLASVLAVKNKGPRPTFASFNGREYVVRPQASGSGTWAATLAVVKPSVAGGAYAGTKLKVFNFPNPFNLENKAVTATYGTVPNTSGTTIHIEVPAANGGPCHIRIYTLAGELVKDISDTCTAGTHNYINWDGKNKGGQEVANGVYYGVVELTGKKPSKNIKDATFKMAVIK